MMVTKTKFGLKGKDRDSYQELVLAFPLCSIRSDEHLDEAQQVMDRLLAKGELGEGEEMYLDALSDLVADYEDEHHAIEPASDADMLRHLVESRGVTQAQLSQEAATTIIDRTILTDTYFYIPRGGWMAGKFKSLAGNRPGDGRFRFVFG